MKWTLAVALVSGFVLAMALTLGGHAMNSPRMVTHDDCCMVAH
jgi:hypothetical protein